MRVSEVFGHWLPLKKAVVKFTFRLFYSINPAILHLLRTSDISERLILSD